jgi:N-acyl-D-amino-acid deacylase
VSADVVIKGGLVVDGTGAAGRPADVAIDGDRIVGIGPNLAGRDEIDASGLVVAPGFIDIHTHFDAQALWDPWLSPSCYHGVTTVVAGNCGLTLAPLRADQREAMIETFELVEDMDRVCLRAGVEWDFSTYPEYLAAVRRRGTMLNFTGFVGHTAVRLCVMGDDHERAATASEAQRMAQLVTDAMSAGAAGFSSSFGAHVGAGGRPVASRFAEMDEVVELAKAVAAAGRGAVAIAPVPNFGFDNAYELARRSGARVTVVALVSLAGGAHEAQL